MKIMALMACNPSSDSDTELLINKDNFEAQKEKEDLKAKVEKWQNSSKNLSKLLNTQMSANDKFGLGYGDHRYDGILSYENEVLQSVFMNKESELENQPLNDRFADGMHVVPPPMTGNYMPSGPDIEIDYSQFTYGPKQTQPSESESQSSECDTCESNISTEPSELVSEPVVIESNVESQPKVWSDAPIIEEYESDSEDECVSIPTKQQETPSFANQQVKTPRETVKNQYTHSQKPKVDKKDLGYGFAVRACFVCGSLNHLIRDCDFHEKRMARKAELNNVNTARASSTKNFSTARQSVNRQTVLTNTAMKVNTVKPIVNRVRPANVFHKTPSPSSRPFKKTTVLRTKFSNQKFNTAKDYPHRALKNKGIVDSGCSRHMTGNKAYLDEFQDFNGGPVAFGGSKGYITGKGKIKTGKLDFEDVCFVKELQHFNLFSVSQMCDKKNKVLFTDSECLVLSPEFKLPDENQVLLKIPRQNNMYSFNLENIVPSGGLACLIAKATTDESNKWHRRLGHVNFKNLNKLVKGNLVRGLPSKIFQNDHTCVACQKGKQHKASCKAKAVSSISQTLQLLHMDLFGPTSVRSLNHKTYCLVITDDFSRFSWVFFLRTKDETSAILKDFIRQIENQLNQKVKTIRSDNGTEFKNKDVIEFCGLKGIKREYSNARTPQQNGVAERKNRTLIEAARTMLADSFLPNTFWAEAVSTACYVLNRVLVTKPHNKTPYELLTGKIPIISYIRPFGCHVTILNTIDHLGKFAGKSDEGFLVGYSLQSKAFRVYNLETKRVEENMHITFLENKPNVAGKGPTWLFDLDYLTDSMNYHPVSSENQANLHAGQQEANQNAGTEEIIDAGDSDKEDESAQDCFVLPIWPSYSSTNTPALTTDDKREGPREEEQVFMDDLERLKRQEKEANEEAEVLRKKFEHLVIKEGAAKPSSKASSTNIFSTVSTPAKASSTNLVNTVSHTLYCHTPIETQKPLVKDEEASDVDVHLYRSMIGSLMYLTASRPDIMFAVCACSSDYAGANLDRKSTTGGVSILVWETISGNAKNYGFNFMNTKIYIDNESTICIVKNPVYHSKTKHIAIRHHFIRDAYEKKLIQVLKIHTDDNVADLLTKAFDVSRESLRRGINGTEALLLSTLFLLWLDIVSTDRAKLVPLGKVCTAIETLKKNTAKALISLLTTITLSTTMAVLDSCPKHNMVAYLEKSEGNAEFHEIIDFLTHSSIHHALTVSPVVSTTFVEQFWMSAKSKIINNVRHITVKVAGKPVSISEASIRSDLIFDDAIGIDSLPNQATCDDIQLMGYEGDFTVLTFNKALFSPQYRPSDIQPTPSPAPTSEVPNEPQTDSSPAQTSAVSDQAKEIQKLKAQIIKLKKQAKPVIKHHRAWLKSSKRSSVFDEVPKKTVEHDGNRECSDEGRTRGKVDEDTEIDEKILKY
ncbi:putative ribonuclease H-like domain-containing protein [Tanacetum coccineum]